VFAGAIHRRRAADARKLHHVQLPAMLRFLTAGESHGQALVVIVEGLPAGLTFDPAGMAADLKRRQGGYGRGRRMAIESDTAEVLSGIRKGETLGGPVALLVRNRDWTNWQNTMHVGAEPPPDATGARRAPVTRPRPGHADLAGALKYERDDMRDILERASARETTMRVAAGALARQLLARFGVHVGSHVFRIGPVGLADPSTIGFADVERIAADSPLHCADAEAEARMIAEIDKAKEAGNTLGGAFEVIATGVPVGLGSHVQWDRKLDGRLAQAIMSIPAIKAVGIGAGPLVAERFGSEIHDEIVLPPPGTAARDLGVHRPTNRAGGLEGGITNGEDLRVTGYMKPIATLMQPLRSVDLATGVESPAAIERSDVCAVPAAAVVGEAMVCLVLADAFLDKFGGDSVAEIEANLRSARARVRAHFAADVTA
jgi:chorismate synthase